MTRKTAHSIAFLIFALGFGLLTRTLVHGFYYAPEKEMAPPQPSFFLATSSLPVKISIPKINLEADVEQVGITFKGNMSTPKLVNNTGWYRYGTIPGEKGSAVIDGHVDNGFGLPGVFTNLKELAIGDEIFIYTESGSRLRFEVIGIETYFYTDVPREILFNKNDDAYLNLITCDGAWLPEKETAEYRLVVYTRFTPD